MAMVQYYFRDLLTAYKSSAIGLKVCKCSSLMVCTLECLIFDLNEVEICNIRHSKFLCHYGGAHN